MTYHFVLVATTWLTILGFASIVIASLNYLAISRKEKR